MDNKAQLKDRLAQLFVELEEYKLSYIQLSKDMCKGSSYVGNLLSGQNSDPSDDFYSYFEIRFHVNAGWLCTGEGPMFLPGGKCNDPSAASYTKMLYSLPDNERMLVQNLVTILVRRHQDTVWG